MTPARATWSVPFLDCALDQQRRGVAGGRHVGPRPGRLDPDQRNSHHADREPGHRSDDHLRSVCGRALTTTPAQWVTFLFSGLAAALLLTVVGGVLGIGIGLAAVATSAVSRLVDRRIITIHLTRPVQADNHYEEK